MSLRDSNVNIFKQRLQNLRKCKNWTQKDLSEALNVARSTIAGWEAQSKENFPDRQSLLRLAKIFDTSVDYLIGNDDNPTSQSEKQNQEYPDIETYLIKVLSGEIPTRFENAEVETAVKAGLQAILTVIQAGKTSGQ